MRCGSSQGCANATWGDFYPKSPWWQHQHHHLPSQSGHETTNAGTQEPFSMILGSTDISGGLQQLPPQWQGLGGRTLSGTGPRPHPRATGIPGEPCPRPLCPQARAALQEKGFSLCSSQPLAAATGRKEGQKPPDQVPAPVGTIPARQWGQTLPRGRTKGLSKARVPAQPRSLPR